MLPAMSLWNGPQRASTVVAKYLVLLETAHRVFQYILAEQFRMTVHLHIIFAKFGALWHTSTSEIRLIDLHACSSALQFEKVLQRSSDNDSNSTV